MSRHLIALCTDKRMLIPALFVARDAVQLRRAHQDEYDVMVVTGKGDVAPDHLAWMEAHNILHWDSPDLSRISDIPISSPRLSSAALYRLLLPGQFADRYNRILYLDSDVRLRKSPGSLFQLDLGDHAFAAARTPHLPTRIQIAGGRERYNRYFKNLGLTPPYTFFNSGVLLMDTDRWSQADLSRRTIDFLRENVENCPFYDECALNAVTDGAFTPLSPVWNLRGWTFNVPDARKLVDAAVVHYDGPIKPWHKYGKWRRLHEYTDETQHYSRFLAGTPWANWLDSQWNWKDLLHNLAFEAAWYPSLWVNHRPRHHFLPRDLHPLTSEFRAFCQETAFADVEQGMTGWNEGVLGLCPQR